MRGCWQYHNRVAVNVAGNCNGCLPRSRQVAYRSHLIGRLTAGAGQHAVSRLRTDDDREEVCLFVM